MVNIGLYDSFISPIALCFSPIAQHTLISPSPIFRVEVTQCMT